MSGLETRRFLIVTGKGGVGKTTVCAAEALAISASNARSRWMARLYAELANVDRPIKIFRNIAAARRWSIAIMASCGCGAHGAIVRPALAVGTSGERLRR